MEAGRVSVTLPRWATAAPAPSMPECAQSGCTNTGPLYVLYSYGVWHGLTADQRTLLRKHARCWPCVEAIDGKMYRTKWTVEDLRMRRRRQGD